MRKEMKLIYGFVIIVCFYMDFVQGGCLSYGHSCWGGHGKRGGGPPRVLQRLPQFPAQMNVNDRWSVVKIFPDKYGYLLPNRGLSKFREFENEVNSIKNVYQDSSSSSENIQIDTPGELERGDSKSTKQINSLQDENSNKLPSGLMKFSNQIPLPLPESDVNTLSESDLNMQIDDIFEPRNMKLLKILNRSIDTNLQN